MARVSPALTTFNAGIFGKKMAARIDQERYPAAAEIMTNFVPQIQGGFERRAGTSFHRQVQDDTKRGRVIGFVPRRSEPYCVEAGDDNFRFFLSGAVISAETVSATVTNGGFESGVTSWTDASTGSAALAHDATNQRAQLTGSSGDTAAMRQTLTITEVNTRHTLAFSTYRGTVTLKIGSTAGGDEIGKFDLGPGNHIISFDPDGNTSVHIQFEHSTVFKRFVDAVSIVSGVPLDLPTVFGESELQKLQWKQSIDVMYFWHPTAGRYKLIRRANDSWSFEEILEQDGPYLAQNTTDITITPGATSGETTLTASEGIFTSSMVGSLFRLNHQGQTASASVSSGGTFTTGVRLVGTTTAERDLNFTISGHVSGTIYTVQRSYDDGLSWVDTQTSYTTGGTKTLNDNRSDELLYRIGVKSGEYVSGTQTITISADGGSTDGSARIIGFTSDTVVTVEVEQSFGRAVATKLWREGAWSAKNGYPTTGTFFGQRLWHAATTAQPQNIWSSVIGDFENHKPGVEDDDPCEFALDSNQSNPVVWMLAGRTLVLGTEQDEWLVRASNLEESITPTNITAKPEVYDGSAESIPALIAAGNIIHVGPTGYEIFEMSQSEPPDSQDMTEVSDEIARSGIREMAYQKRPYSQILLLRNDGRIICLVYRPGQSIGAFWLFETDGVVESIASVPASDRSDRVYMIVRRTINGTETRFVESWLTNEDWRLVGDQDSAIPTDCSVCATRTTPAAELTPAAKSGTGVTFTTDANVFSSSDVGSIIRANWGVAKVVSFVGADEITADILFPLDDTYPVISGEWSIDAEAGTVTGADHLDGATIDIYGDGGYRGTAVPSSGTVTLPSNMSAICVGLRFDAKWKAWKLPYGGSGGTALTHDKKIPILNLIIDRSTMPKVGHSLDEVYQIQWPENYTISGRPNRLFTGEIDRIPYSPATETDPRIVVIKDVSEPCSIQAFVPVIETQTR